MGQDKAAVTLNGLSLLQHALTALREVCGEVRFWAGKSCTACSAPSMRTSFPAAGR